MIWLANGASVLYQWERGVTVNCDKPCDVLSVWREDDKKAKRIVPAEVQGVYRIEIPRQLLQQSGYLRIEAIDAADDGERVIDTERIIIRPRKKPDDYPANGGEAEYWQSLNLRMNAIERKAREGDFDGEKGDPGITPHVGANGNWYLGDTDTGVHASGIKGAPYIGENGNWWFNGVDSGVQAKGEKGDPGNDGLTPYIGDDGNWHIGETNTHVTAQTYLVGDIKETERTDLGEDWILCNGAVLPREEYPALRKWLRNDLTYRKIEGLPTTKSWELLQPLMNGEWMLAETSPTNDYYLTCYLYDPNTETLKTVKSPLSTELGTSYTPYMLGITFDGEKYVRILGYANVTSTASYQTIYVQTSVDADVWETAIEYTREADYLYRQLYFDGERILMGGYRTVTETSSGGSSSTYYYKKVWVIDLDEKTVTALTDGTEKSKARTTFFTSPVGYWSYPDMCKSGETAKCFPYDTFGGSTCFFNDRFMLRAASATATVLDLQTGDSITFAWSMILGGNTTYDCYGSFYNEETNMWRFPVYHDTDTDKYYNLHISANADPRDPDAWTVELTALTAKETTGGSVGWDRSKVKGAGSTPSYRVEMYNSALRFLPTNDGETYKYIYGYGDVEEVVPETPDYVENDRYAPEGFERLYALESTGTQYIDMGFAPSDGISSTVLATLPPVDGYSNYLYGTKSSTSSNKDSYSMFVASNYLDRYYFNTGTYQVGSDSGTVTNGLMLVRRKGKFSYANGTAASSTAGTFSETATNIYLFGTNTAGTAGYGYCKIVSAKFYDADGNPIRDYIPVRRIYDGALGMWDKVTETFYGNDGTGEFIAHEYREARKPKALDYIATTGTQYIDTGVKPTQNTRIEAEVSGWGADEAATYLYNATTSYGLQTTNNTLYRAYYGAAYKDFASGTSAADRVTITRDGTTAWIGNASVTNDAKTFTASYNMLLFAQNSSGTAQNFAKLRLHYFKIYEGDELIRDYVPCKSKYGAVCLYDRVSGKYVYNAGTYEFLAGPEIGNIEEDNR